MPSSPRVTLHRLPPFVALLCLLARADARAADPLPSWNEGPARASIVAFVAAVTKEGGPDFVPAAERIATFDNDGTLWCEQPLYVQAVFAIDRVKALAPKHPEWKEKQPFAAFLSGDREALRKLTEHDVAALMAVTHAGITTDEFADAARRWLDTARHPRFGRRFKECVYQPQLELLAYLRASGF